MLYKTICVALIAILIISKAKNIIKCPEAEQTDPVKQYSLIRDDMLQLEELRKRLDAIEDMITKIESNEFGTDATAMELYMHDVPKLQLIVNNNSSILTALYDERNTTRSSIKKIIKSVYGLTETLTETSVKSKKNKNGGGVELCKN